MNNARVSATAVAAPLARPQLIDDHAPALGKRTKADSPPGLPRASRGGDRRDRSDATALVCFAPRDFLDGDEQIVVDARSGCMMQSPTPMTQRRRAVEFRRACVAGKAGEAARRRRPEARRDGFDDRSETRADIRAPKLASTCRPTTRPERGRPLGPVEPVRPLPKPVRTRADAAAVPKGRARFAFWNRTFRILSASAAPPNA